MSSLNLQFVKELQTHLKNLGFYSEEVDGIAGSKTREAYEKMINSCSVASLPVTEPDTQSIAWGKKVSPTFKARVLWISEALEMANKDIVLGASRLMSVMAFETGESFSAGVKNAAGSSGTGLIQFMSFTAKALGTTVEALAKMTPEDQLNYVYKYFLPYKGKLNSLADIYLAVLYPKAMAAGENDVVWVQGKDGLLYTQNKGLDTNKDGKITKREIVALVSAKYTKGMTAAYKG